MVDLLVACGVNVPNPGSFRPQTDVTVSRLDGDSGVEMAKLGRS